MWLQLFWIERDGKFICVLYLVGIQFFRSISEVEKLVTHGKEYQFSIVFDAVYMLILWLPFMLIILNCVWKREWDVILESSKKVIWGCWKQYAIYLIVLLLILKGVGLGDMQYDISLIHVVVDLMPSFSSYVIMQLLYHVFRSANSILFFILAPLMYCIEFEILVQRKLSFG